VFPFRHELQYDARLEQARMIIEVTVRASGAEPVPLAFGFHPYISLPGAPRERWQVELPAMRRLALDDHQIPTGPDRTFAARRFELADRELDDAFDQLPETARFAVEGAGRRVEVEFLHGYPCAQVFAPLNAACICFEPMTAPPNALRSGMGLRLLSPGGSARACFALRLRDA
jgi:galactose mutarotase-like enzyme